MDVGNIRNLMRKTQASILEKGFLDIRINELQHVSAAAWLHFLYNICAIYFLACP